MTDLGREFQGAFEIGAEMDATYIRTECIGDAYPEEHHRAGGQTVQGGAVQNYDAICLPK